MKIFCIGRNYAQHIKELANEKPSTPVVFMKPDSAILALHSDFILPSYSSDVHYEVEVLVKINQQGKSISIENAPDYYSSVGLGIDFTARDIQQQCKDKGLPWEKAKCFDGSAVIGDFYPKEMFDLKNLPFQLLQNETLVQDGNTGDMLWSIDEVIVELSQYFTFSAGDIIFMGTPAGVGQVRYGDQLKGMIANEVAFDVTCSG